MLLAISERGQVTIPAAIRTQLDAKYLECEFDGENLILKPVQTKEEFLNELDDIYEDYKKNGGYELPEAKKLLGLSDEL